MARYMKTKKTKKRVETSKIVLWSCLSGEVVMLIVIVIGWFRGLSDAPAMFTSVCILMGVTIAGYYCKSGFDNSSKFKIGANIIPDVFTMLQGILSALQSNNVASASQSVLNAIQVIVANHPDFTSSDIPNYIELNNNQNEVAKG